ncbi:MAG: isoprenyl transferase [Fuerstiella sp.]|nr:isoprenyl transferase [Fuerstiella sp.]
MWSIGTLSRQEPYTEYKLEELGLARDRLPRHIAVIMDGNGRWAQQRGLPRIEGHRRGVASVREIVEECSRLGLEQLTLYCFSSENWKRPPGELSFLMRLLKKYVVDERQRIQEQGLQFRVIGHIDELHPEIQEEIEITARDSANNQGMTLCLALNYGARSEITHAMRQIAVRIRDGLLQPDEISNETVAEHLMTVGMPDPDLVIRTANEMRISNFLLWQISYSELWVTEKLWPEFRNPHLHAALRDFSGRDRRFGGLNASPAAVQ